MSSAPRWGSSGRGLTISSRHMTVEKRYSTGLAQALLAVLCLSITPTLIKVGLAANVDPITLLALRLLTATATFWIVFPLFWPGLLRIDRRGLAACTAVAAANATSLLCFYLALTYIPASVAHMILSLYPLAALLLLATRGERITRFSVVRLALAIGGVYLLIGPGGQVNPVGVALVLATAVAYALHMVLSQWFLSEYPSQTVALYVVTFMALILAVVRLLQFEPWQPLSPAGWGVVLATGLVSTVLARLAMFAGIQRIGSGQTALLGPMETFLTVMWAMVFLGERLAPVQAIGGVVILVSAILAVRRPHTVTRQQKAGVG
jgi:drug/metabolite transporter (DMT)-like permease